MKHSCASRASYFILSLLALGSQVNAGDDSQQRPPQDLARYKVAIFKVIGLGNLLGLSDEEIPLGTATLIHPDGFFITAAHIFDPDQNGELLGKRVSVHQHVRLRNRVDLSSGFTTIDAELIFLGSFEKNDLAILKSTKKLDWQFDYPELSLGRSWSVDKKIVPVLPDVNADIYGYPTKEGILQRYVSTHLNLSDQEDPPILVAVPLITTLSVQTKDALYGGMSGSVALSDHGTAMGVLHNKPEKVSPKNAEAVRYLFTPTAYVPEEWLNQLPLTADGDKLNKLIRKGELSDVDQLWFMRAAHLTNIDLWKIVNAVTQSPRDYPGLTRFAAQLFFIRCYGADLFPYLGVFPSPPPPKLALETAARLGVLSAHMKDANYLAGAQAARLQSIQLYAAAQRSPKLKLDEVDPSNAYFDYGLALEDAWRNYPELKITPADATEKYKLAIQADPGNPNPYRRIANIATDLKQDTTAKEYASMADEVAKLAGRRPPLFKQNDSQTLFAWKSFLDDPSKAGIQFYQSTPGERRQAFVPRWPDFPDTPPWIVPGTEPGIMTWNPRPPPNPLFQNLPIPLRRDLIVG